MENKIEKVQKRDGSIVPFDQKRIEEAIFKALTASGQGDGKKAKKLSNKVVQILNRRFKKGEIPHVEQIQDIVEEVLILEGLVKTAKAYILYREQRRRIREAIKVSEEAVDRLDQYLEKLDWEVQENANMAFSLQGLNHYGVSYIIKKYWLNKIYPPEIREAHDSGDFHIHNLDTLGPYTFFGKEVVIAKLKGEIKLLSLENLYEEICEPEILLNEKDEAFAKYPKDLYVLDKNGWTRVSRLVRKKKDREMRFIKSKQGQSIIVTDNHPFIIKEKLEEPEKEIEAQKVKIKNHLILSCHIPSLLSNENLFFKKHIYIAEELVKRNYENFFLEGFEWRDFIENWRGSLKVEGTVSTSNSANSLDNKLELSENLGYLVGFFIAEGNYDSWRLCLTASENEIIKKIQRICAQLGVRAYLNEKEGETKRISINSSTLKLVFEKVFQIKPLSQNKNLPFDILTYNLDFIKGLIAGIIDGDGSIGTEKTQIIIRVASRTLLEQLAILLQFFGIVPRTGATTKDIGKKNLFKGKEIVQNYPLYRLSFSKKEGIDFPSFKYQKAKPAKKHWRSEEYGWNKVLNNETTTIPDNFIYDITTESHTFLCNSLFVHNCVGWDLYDLLLKGFGGVPGKVESKPAKHFRAALGQIVNFMYTLQGECFSEDTQVLTENGWKYFYEVTKEDRIFTLNVQNNKIELQHPIRFYEYNYNGTLYNFKSKKLDLLVTPGHRMLVDQYVPNSKEKYHKKFVEAKDFNPNTHFIPKQGVWEGREEKYFVLPAIKVFQIRNYNEVPFTKNLRFLTKTSEVFGEILSIEDFKVKTSQPISKYQLVEIPEKKILMDDWLKFFGFWLAEGSTTLRERKRKGRKNPYYEYQVRISQNEGEKAKEFERILKRLPFNYIKKKHKKKIEFEILSKQLFLYLRQFGKNEEKFIPKEIKNLSKRQLKILFDWMMKGDGYVGNGNIDYYTKSKKLADDVQEIVLKLGWSANIYEKRKGNFKWYRVAISKSKHFKFQKENIKKVKYKGKVYCLEVPNHTLYVRRNGKALWCGNCAGAISFSNFDTLLAPFIRYDNLSYQQVKQALQEFLFNMAIPTRVGFQCPFTNITLDLRPSPVFKNLPVIIGGRPQDKTYGDFEEEMKIFDKALYEVYMEGDAKGRPFHFPIPTINITKDFPWEEPAFDGIFEASAKYGTNYFANYINSDMKPEDVRSMCPLGGREMVLIKSSRGRGFEYSSIKNIVKGHSKQNEYWVFSDGKFVKGKFNVFKNQKMMKVILVNNHEIEMSEEHLNFVLEDFNSKEIKVLKGKELKEGMYLPYSLKAYEGKGGNRELGFFVGAYAGDGSLDDDVGVIFSLNKDQKQRLGIKLQQIAEKYFGAHCKFSSDPNKKTLFLRVNSKTAVGLCKEFVAGKETNKFYTSRVFEMSKEFRWGVIEGHLATDGGGRNRIYTSSPKMVETLNMLAATLGTTTAIYKDDRPGRLGKKPNYAVLIYKLNRKKLKGIWFKKFGKLWVKIKKVKKLPYRADAYCFEVEDDVPMFTVGTTGILTHNCRLRLDLTELYNRGGGGLFGAGSKTGSIGVVTINLPRIGYLSKTKKEFFERLAKVMDLAKESLEIKRKVLENYIEKGLYPYSRYYLQDIKKIRGKYWANHFSTIGLVGMNECLLNFMGENIASKRGRKFALEVLDFMRERLVKYQKESGNIYNLEATPAESTAYRLALKDKERYPDIITAGTKKVPYYTNSTQLPVNYTDDVFEALKLQDDLQCKYSGGTVLHILLGERMQSGEGVKRLVRKVFENFKLPYITITPTFSICPVHGYISGEHFFCPKCTIKQPCEVYSRIVGYYRPVQQWNLGKQQEFKQRKEFKIKEG